MSKSARVMAWIAAHPLQADAAHATVADALAPWGVTANDVRQARYQQRRGRPTRPALPSQRDVRSAAIVHGSVRKAAAILGIPNSTAHSILRRRES